jgi:hypothetical protein
MTTVGEAITIGIQMRMLLEEYDVTNIEACYIFGQVLARKKLSEKGIIPPNLANNSETKNEITQKMGEEINELINGYASDILESGGE